MDDCAELTLRVVRFAQERRDLKSSLVHWHFFPGSRRATWSEAREILSGAPKPVIVAALLEPGTLALWHLDDFDAAERDALEYEFANQQAYINEKVTLLGLSDADSVILDASGGVFQMTVAEFKRWTKEYATSLGITLKRSPDAHIGRILIRPPGGGGPPLGRDPVEISSSSPDASAQ
jgi:hypothetical protein